MTTAAFDPLLALEKLQELESLAEIEDLGGLSKIAVSARTRRCTKTVQIARRCFEGERISEPDGLLVEKKRHAPRAVAPSSLRAATSASRFSLLRS